MDYRLYYWPLPFRGNFIRYLLAHAGADYEEAPLETVQAMRTQAVAELPLPAMAVPLLHDLKRDVYLNQMPAVVQYLSECLGYAPQDSYQKALALKVVLDCNDMLGELTNANGAQMWTLARWQVFRYERFVRWLHIFEALLVTNERDANMVGDRLSSADIAVAALFGTMVRCLPELKPDVLQHAPRLWAICEHVEAQAGVAALISAQQSTLGALYCGGEIEASIREMLRQE